MKLTDLLRDELAQERATTAKFFARYPAEQPDFAPHQKSMALSHLATHISQIFGWPGMMLATAEMDVAAGTPPALLKSGESLTEAMDQQFAKSAERLEKTSAAELEEPWSLKANGHLLKEWSKYGAIRHALNQLTHHRAQLGVYYRLLDIPLPGSYGPSADDQSF